MCFLVWITKKSNNNVIMCWNKRYNSQSLQIWRKALKSRAEWHWLSKDFSKHRIVFFIWNVVIHINRNMKKLCYQTLRIPSFYPISYLLVNWIKINLKNRYQIEYIYEVVGGEVCQSDERNRIWFDKLHN